MYSDSTHEHETINATDFRRDASDTIGRVQHGHHRVVIQRNGKPAAALVSIEDLHLLEVLEDKLDLLLARTALAEHEASGDALVSWDDIKAREGL